MIRDALAVPDTSFVKQCLETMVLPNLVRLRVQVNYILGLVSTKDFKIIMLTINTIIAC